VDIFNDQPAELEVSVSFTFPTFTVTKEELPAFADELDAKDLTVDLVLLLPFQFTAATPIPIFAGQTGSLPNPAMKLVTTTANNGDLFGRSGSGDSGVLGEVLTSLKALTLEITAVNNLGINGEVIMLSKIPTTYPPPYPAGVDELGTINLSGKSTIRIPKSTLDIYPFSPALEIYLKGDFDIKRSLPTGAGAMSMNMGIILQTGIDMTF
jgi:hypothetical protein